MPAIFEKDETFAVGLDSRDPLARFRDLFFCPATRDGKRTIYFSGNSLGLQPLGVKEALDQEISDWKSLAVRGHFEAKNPWYSYHESLSPLAAEVVGAKPDEVVLMNSLTANLHLMMITFYNPTRARHKILIEHKAFPSDRYAVESQIRLRGFDPADSLLVMKPEPGQDIISVDAVESLLKKEGDGVALVLFGGVNYYSGQAFDMKRIAAAAKARGCAVGFDLAHAAGNVLLELHGWDADFAVWCNYKYLNSGPGAVGGCFVHERHGSNPALPRLAGWWGNDPTTRFQMSDEFSPRRGAAGWQLSNAPVFGMAPCRVSLDLFHQAGMSNLTKKSETLTGYLEFLLRKISGGGFEIITPSNPAERGCQLSIRVDARGREVFRALEERGVACDFREPDVIRAAPVPLYNSFHEAWTFARIFGEAISG